MDLTAIKVKDLLSVYFIMGSVNCLREPTEVLREAILGGITLFQFREKGKGCLDEAAKKRLALELQQICQKANIPFFVNDDVNLAIKLKADGIHIGQDDESVKKVRERVGDMLVGVSVHTLAEAKKAVLEGADYLGIGPIFPTSTKEDAKTPQEFRVIQQIRQAGMDIPIVGIGGIQIHNAQSVIEAGADGVSVITAISHSESVRESAELLKKAVKEGLKIRGAIYISRQKGYNETKR
jgi:thiamine-phosphate pyrophosphorylase